MFFLSFFLAVEAVIVCDRSCGRGLHARAGLMMPLCSRRVQGLSREQAFPCLCRIAQPDAAYEFFKVLFAVESRNQTQLVSSSKCFSQSSSRVSEPPERWTPHDSGRQCTSRALDRVRRIVQSMGLGRENACVDYSSATGSGNELSLRPRRNARVSSIKSNSSPNNNNRRRNT